LVEGQLSVSAAGDVVSLTFEVPDGRWAFDLADGLEPRTPSGEAIIDISSLTGPAGLTAGPGLDGFVAGDRSCLGSSADTGSGTDPASGTAASEAPAGSAATTG